MVSDYDEIIKHLLTSTKTDLPSPWCLYTPPSVYNNYKLEEITCKGLTTKFDCEQQNLMPWLDRIWECFISDPWSPATYFTNDDGTTHDLLTFFAAVDEDDKQANAHGRWATNDAHTLSHQHDSSQFHSWIFGRFFVNSITNDLYSTIVHKMDESIFHDGTYLFWYICHYVYRNAISFITNIKMEVCSKMLLPDYKGY